MPDQKPQKSDFGIDQTPGVGKERPFRDAVKRCCGTEATAVFDLRVFLSREPETHVFDSLASFLPCAHCVCTRMRDLTAYTCKALQELNQADVYAPRIRHSHASGGVVSLLIRCAAPSRITRVAFEEYAMI